MVLIAALLAAAAAPAHATAPSGTGGARPGVTVAPAHGGGCRFRWQGAPASQGQLTAHAALFLKRATDRLGEPDATVPIIEVDVAEDSPWHCVRRGLRALAEGGAPAVRLGGPAEALTFSIDLKSAQRLPDGAAVRNRISLPASGIPAWNGAPVAVTVLRQYLALTQQMRPLPLLTLDVADATPYRKAEPLLAAVSQARAIAVELTGSGISVSAVRD